MTSPNGNDQVVLIACHAWFHEQIGGSFKLATELAEFLSGRGYRVCYVCGTKDRAPVNPSAVEGVELWRYPFPRARSPHPANLLSHVRGTHRVTREILRSAPIACLNGHTPLQFLGASLAVGKACSRRVYTVHSPFDDELRCAWHGQGRGIIRRGALAVAKAIDRANCRRATVVTCESRYTASRLIEKHGEGLQEKTLVSPGWVDTERFRPVERVKARSILGSVWRTEEPIFLTVRRLEHRMGLDRLIEACRILVAQGQPFRMLIGGGGSLRGDLEQQVLDAGLQTTVQFLGRISDAELPRCYAAANCFVLPTTALECFGLIVLEAFACGTPVIGTPVGAIPETAALQGTEWLTAGTDAKHIAERMAAFLQGRIAGDATKLRTIAEEWSAQHGLNRLSRVVEPRPAT